MIYFDEYFFFLNPFLTNFAFFSFVDKRMIIMFWFKNIILYVGEYYVGQSIDINYKKISWLYITISHTQTTLVQFLSCVYSSNLKKINEQINKHNSNNIVIMLYIIFYKFSVYNIINDHHQPRSVVQYN